MADSAMPEKLLPPPISNSDVTLVPISPPINNSPFHQHRPPRATLNVGGIRHEVMWKTLNKLPNTRLGKLYAATCEEDIQNICDDFNLTNNEYFFDRNPTNFNPILNFYRTGKLHFADEMCFLDFGEDLLYWGIEEAHIAICCQPKYYQKKENVAMEINLEFLQERDEQFGEGRLSEYRKYLWYLFEKPMSSYGARAVAAVGIIFTVLSVFAATLNTVAALQECSQQSKNSTLCDMYPNRNLVPNRYEVNDTPDRPISQDELWIENHTFANIIQICVIWITVEYVIRLLVSPNKRKFLLDWLNNVDLFVILSFFTAKILQQQMRTGTVEFLIMRIFRVLKIWQQSTSYRSLVFTLRKSSKDLALVGLFLIFGVLIFSSMAYFSERDDNDDFASIPITFWWALVTMTTVGYGDMYPKTVAGKLIGAACSVYGVLIIALQIPILVNNFSEFYKNEKRMERVQKQRKALEKAKCDNGHA